MSVRLSVRCVALSVVVAAGCDYDHWADWFHHHHGGHGHHGGGHTDAGVPCDAGGPAACAEDQFARGTTCIRKATSVSAGFFYTCAVLAGGDLKCWGQSSWGVLGYGSPDSPRGDAPNELGDALPPVSLGAGLTAVQVSAGSDLTCALLEPNSTKCWGYNGYGAAGNPIPTSGLAPDVLPARTFAPQEAVWVVAGPGFGTALRDDGLVSAWGQTPPNFGAGRVAVAFDRISIYDNWHTCAVLDDGDVVCGGVGGSLSSGALGYGVAPPGDAPTVALGTGRTALAVATGFTFTCALLDDQSVKCWGANSFGQLGQGDTTARGTMPASMGDALLPVPLGQPAVAITAGYSHACAILADGSVRCWGQNDHGQLGIGSTNNIGDQAGEVAALSAVDLGTGRTAVAIDAGGHTCVVLDNGGIKCWGANTTGQLGQGDVVERGSAPGQLGDALAEIDLGQ